MPKDQKSWIELYRQTDTFSVGCIGLFLLGVDPKRLTERIGDVNGRRNLALDPFCLVANEKGTAEEKLVSALAKILTRETSQRGTLQQAERVFKKLM